jgi:pyruvate,water dikinase
MHFIRWFSDVAMGDVSVVGGKNASLGEMIRELTRSGIRVPDGYAVTADGYRHFIRSNGFAEHIAEVLAGADHDDSSDLTRRTRKIRNLIHSGDYPEDLRDEILASYKQLADRVGFEDPYVAIRSSATAEDLPTASATRPGWQSSSMSSTDALLQTTRRVVEEERRRVGTPTGAGAGLSSNP